jgi:hypothetical protein
MTCGLPADAGVDRAVARFDGAILPREAWRWQECKYLPSVEKFLKGLGGGPGFGARQFLHASQFLRGLAKNAGKPGGKVVRAAGLEPATHR